MTVSNSLTQRLANKVEVHYFFRDNSHSMDAYVKHGCEDNLLKLIESLISFLDADLKVESEPYKEGGLRQIWKFVGVNQNAVAITIVVNVLTLLLSRVPPSPTSTKSKLEILQEKNTELEIRQRELDLKEKEEHSNIKDELLKERKKIIDSLEKQIQSGTKTVNFQKDLDKITNLINSNRNVAEHRSNFFRILNNYEKVTQFSSAILTEDNKEIYKPHFIKKQDFKKFINVVARYHDEKMPYSFMWWLDKTRKEHANVYQPFSSEINTNKDPLTENDLRMQKYFDKLSTSSELDKVKNDGEVGSNDSSIDNT